MRLPADMATWRARRGFSALLVAVLTTVPLAPASAEMVHGGYVRSVDLSADGTRLLSGSFDYVARLWDVEAQRELRRLDGHDGAVNAAIFLPGGGQAATAGDDLLVIIWDLGSGTPLRRMNGHKGKVVGLDASPDGRLIASAGWDRAVKIWSADTGAEVRQLKHPANVNTVAFTADGAHLLSGAADGRLRRWDLATGRLLSAVEAHQFSLVDVALVPGAGAPKVLTVGIDETMRLWNLDSGLEIRRYGEHDGPILALAVSPDGRLAATGGADGFVRIWEIKTGKVVHILQGHGETVWSVAFSSDGRHLVTGGNDEAARVWDVGYGVEIGAVGGPSGHPPPPDLGPEFAQGRRLYRTCHACHTVQAGGANRAGPPLHGVFGRRAGSVAGFNYSPALRDSELVWTEETIGKLFEIGPDKLTPGTKMPLQRMPDPSDRAALIAYLKEITSGAGGAPESAPSD